MSPGYTCRDHKWAGVVARTILGLILGLQLLRRLAETGLVRKEGQSHSKNLENDSVLAPSGLDGHRNGSSARVYPLVNGLDRTMTI